MFDLVYPPAGTAPLVPHPTADHPSSEYPVGAEMVPVVEPDGKVVGQASRQYIHSGSKVLHPVVHLHIINRWGKLYLQKRSMSKDLLPGRWDTAVGGHVDFGEHLVEALYRESKEELHFTKYNAIYLTSYVWESETEKELVNVFAAVGNFRPKPDPYELADGRYWSMQEIEENLGKSVFTPNFESEFLRLRKSLEALL